MSEKPGGVPASARTTRAGAAGLDGLLTIYEAAARAWGRIQERGAPAAIETEIVSGCARLRDLIVAAQDGRPGDAERAALAAARLQNAVREFERWRSAGRP